MTQENNTQAALDAGSLGANAANRITYIGSIPVCIRPDKDGAMKVDFLTAALDEQEARGPAPMRLKGTATLTELDSFTAHVNRFADPSSAVFADTRSVQLTAVLNYHQGAAPGGAGGPALPRWGDHRAVYACPLSDAWKIWTGQHEKWMEQDAFGQFIEDNLGSLASPDPANPLDKDMPAPARVLEVARSLVIHAGHKFERTINVSTGEGTFAWKEEHAEGSTKVPKSFLLQLQVFEAGTAYRVEARLRYQLGSGKVKFQYSLYQPDIILKDAFGEVREKVKAATGLPVFAGSPEQ